MGMDIISLEQNGHRLTVLEQHGQGKLGHGAIWR